MFKIINNIPADIFGVEMIGKLTKEDYEKMTARVEEHRNGKEDLKFLMVIKDFEWKTFDAFWADLKMDVKYLGSVEKTAVVTEKKWMETVSKAIGIVTPKMKVKNFKLDEKDKAVEWLEKEEE